MVRPYEDRDAEAAASLLTANSPWFSTAAGIRHRLASLPPRAHRAMWVAEADGAVVGWGEAEFNWTAERDDVGEIYALVGSAHRGRALGSALFDRAVEHVVAHGASEVRSWSFPDSDGFLERRGFRRAREERMSALDPRTVDTTALDALPPGVEAVAVQELTDRLEEVHAVYAEASADAPADHAERKIPYDEWLGETLGDPDLRHDGSAVVLVDGRPASLSWVKADLASGLAEQELTGTARAYRRRGLARLAKLAVIRWAAANGITRLSTGNDATNAGMLALNDALGFRPFAVETEWAKELG